MASEEFATKVTTIKPEWANDVNDLVYDVFGAAKTAAAARLALGLGSLAQQNANAVNIEAGIINGTSIGQTAPNAGTFTVLRNMGSAIVSTDVVTLGLLDSRLSTLGPLSTMDPAAVNFSGGLIVNTVIQGGSLNGTPVGNVNPSSGRFTTVSIQTPLPVTSGGTGSFAYTGRYLVFMQLPTAHFEAVDEIPLSDVQGVGSMASQDANAVGISGGSINGVVLGNDVVYSSLGSMAVQQANSVNITGGRLENVDLVGVTYQLAVQHVNDATVIDHLKDVIILDGTDHSYIVDLPIPGLVTRAMRFKKIGSFRVDLRAPVTVTIDGEPVHNLFNDKESVTLVSDGINYFAF